MLTDPSRHRFAPPVFALTPFIETLIRTPVGYNEPPKKFTFQVRVKMLSFDFHSPKRETMASFSGFRASVNSHARTLGLPRPSRTRNSDCVSRIDLRKDRCPDRNAKGARALADPSKQVP